MVLWLHNEANQKRKQAEVHALDSKLYGPTSLERRKKESSIREKSEFNVQKSNIVKKSARKEIQVSLYPLYCSLITCVRGSAFKALGETQ